MKNQILFLFVGFIMMIGCQNQQSDKVEVLETNPILSTWDTPFGVPPFNQIKDEDYLPAFRSAIATNIAEIKTIINNTEEASFENTIVALERSGEDLSRVSRVFYAINGAHSNDSIREIAKIMAPELSVHRDNIRLNVDLYARVKAVYDQRDELNLNLEQLKLLEEKNKGFVRAGVNLEGQAKVRLREINEEIAKLSQAYSENLLAETNDFKLQVTNETDLGNLPASLVALAANEAERNDMEGWVFTLSRPSINPFLQYSPNREMRKELFDAYALRGDNDNAHDNKEDLAKIAALRAERAQLMGFETHAEYVLSDNMAETPQQVYDFLDQVWTPAIEVAKDEKGALEAMMHAEGTAGDLMGWDWRYYVEKVRQAKFDLNEDELRPYFEVNAVRDGVFLLANNLFGLTFTQLEDMPVWQKDQQVFEVKEADGTHVGIVYLDFFARESKRGGAWMNSLRSQSRFDGIITPIVTTNFNFPAPTENSPSLLSFTEAQTLFHEFGHALHGLLSNVTYPSLSGTNVPRDFVEFPSEVMENWMGEPEVLKLYAKHYQTGEVIPDELIAKVKASGTFNQGFATVEYMAASYLDMSWHMIEDTRPKDARLFEIEEMERIGLIPEIIPRYRSTYFSHIFSGGYSAGYYSYLWSEVLDADAFQAFIETSIFDQETAQRYRNMLSQGGTRPGMELYIEFRGREPEITPLLEKRGLTN